jgi:G:T/U-mismatch repair DNA glycosylase
LWHTIRATLLTDASHRRPSHRLPTQFKGVVALRAVGRRAAVQSCCGFASRSGRALVCDSLRAVAPSCVLLLDTSAIAQLCSVVFSVGMIPERAQTLRVGGWALFFGTAGGS